jgi:hypothetical protein
MDYVNPCMVSVGWYNDKGCWLDNRGLDSAQEQDIFLYSKTSTRVTEPTRPFTRGLRGVPSD